MSILHNICFHGNVHCLRLTLKYCKNLDINIRATEKYKYMTPLHLVVRFNSLNHYRCLKLLLNEKYIDINPISDQLTPLFIAMLKFNFLNAKLLILKGARTDIKLGKYTISDYISYLPEFKALKSNFHFRLNHQSYN